ncbi:MAG: nuclear transport factor 2 family protein [Actinobacteria bacterium]|nr:nuclear transport factor 2 family protein [Actinomycetota bacterium]
MSEDSIRVVREIYEAFEQGDMDGVFGRLDEDIDWREPDGYFVAAGGVRGHAAVQGALARYPEVWEQFSLDPETFLDAGEHVVVLGRQSGVARATGREFSGRFANVWLVQGGKARAFEAFADTGLIWKAFDAQPPGPAGAGEGAS